MPSPSDLPGEQSAEIYVVNILYGEKKLEPIKYEIIAHDDGFAIASEYATLSGFETYGEALIAKRELERSTTEK